MTKNTSKDNWVVFLFVTFLFIWLYLAISPVNRLNWAIENILPFLFILFLYSFYNKIPLSLSSYTFITFFLILHTIGAHYSYHTPLDKWLSFKRAYYDRVVHFSFGLCFLLPIYQIIRFFHPISRLSAIIFANISLLAASSMYELMEVWVVSFVAPKEGALFLGLQGDLWDAQHDMQIALVGSIVASMFFLLYVFIKKQRA
ncbi:DUF2238 domain-containing protein [Shimazuella sp. AN120528]|uniref:DUF2238 domain-containing protein n=1 Tax=Shimazuella soli TaxID=1892854 RepID=UPI001F0EC992|nr:DUF2238 domain-containing protein [Shimazuella soli]MCH5584168.1 DUF2238 domain-containing protein [Shimazuella soli]